MKYLDEFRDPALARVLVDRIKRLVTRPWVLMEVCGGQTHSIIRHGIDRLLPPELELIHGPGCPVCVTPVPCIDEAIAMASQPGLIFTTFADMLRVPGSNSDLLATRAMGADIRSVYSPLDAVEIAAANPDRQVVFFAVGFETTAPANAMSVLRAEARRLDNFSLLVSQVMVPPAIEAIATAPGNRVQAFLAAGHVCTVMGYWQYENLASRLGVPIVVTGFEPLDLLLGVAAAVQQLEQGQAQVENCYGRCVTRDGNTEAQKIIDRVFATGVQNWRGLGDLPASGLGLREHYRRFDARLRFPCQPRSAGMGNHCRAGEVLTGKIRPDQCPYFAGECTPENPLGATMVSAEGACAAYYRYRSRPTLNSLPSPEPTPLTPCLTAVSRSRNTPW
jgi:hydrogenase expression/formation protein HypD